MLQACSYLAGTKRWERTSCSRHSQHAWRRMFRPPLRNSLTVHIRQVILQCPRISCHILRDSVRFPRKASNLNLSWQVFRTDDKDLKSTKGHEGLVTAGFFLDWWEALTSHASRVQAAASKKERKREWYDRCLNTWMKIFKYFRHWQRVRNLKLTWLL